MADEWRNLPRGSEERKAALDRDLGEVLGAFNQLERSRLKVAIAGGELLQEIKSERGHGHWQGHVIDNFKMKLRTVQKWKRIFRYRAVLPRHPDTGEYVHDGLEEALEWTTQYEKEQKAFLQGQIRTEAPGTEAEEEETMEGAPAPAEAAVSTQQQPDTDEPEENYTDEELNEQRPEDDETFDDDPDPVFGAGAWVPDNVQSIVDVLHHFDEKGLSRIQRALHEEMSRRMQDLQREIENFGLEETK